MTIRDQRVLRQSSNRRYLWGIPVFSESVDVAVAVPVSIELDVVSPAPFVFVHSAVGNDPNIHCLTHCDHCDHCGHFDRSDHCQSGMVKAKVTAIAIAIGNVYAVVGVVSRVTFDDDVYVVFFVESHCVVVFHGDLFVVYVYGVILV